MVIDRDCSLPAKRRLNLTFLAIIIILYFVSRGLVVAAITVAFLECDDNTLFLSLFTNMYPDTTSYNTVNHYFACVVAVTNKQDYFLVVVVALDFPALVIITDKNHLPVQGAKFRRGRRRKTYRKGRDE